jgi:hypothetical protein
MGGYMLRRDDVIEGRRFDDVTGRSGFPAAGHHVASINTVTTGGVTPKDGGTHDIAYRCLVPKNVENMLIAGRHVSTDRDSYLRFLQETMVTGQAAGAALCATMNITPRQLGRGCEEAPRDPSHAGCCTLRHSLKGVAFGRRS